MSSVPYDAIVVGSGAAGACTAYSMVMKGMKVLCLEKGPWLELPDFFEGGLYGKRFASFGRGDELLFKEKEILMPPLKKELRYMSYEGSPLERTEFGWQSQMVGGGTVHYGGASFRAKPVDMLMKSTFGSRADLNTGLGSEACADLRDWPISFEELEPWYSFAEKLIGIAGAPNSELPPLRFNKAANLISEALKKNQALSAEVIPTPMAINSSRHDGRSPCHHSGLCQDFACRFEAKSDMRVTTLKHALKTGNLQIQPGTFVRKINHNNGRVISVDCISGTSDPVEKTLPCPLLVVACECIESVRLLLASNAGNQDVLGHYFMVHTTGGGRSKAPVPTTTWDTAPHTAYIDSFYDASGEGPSGFLKAGILLVSSASGPVFEVGSKKLFGEQAKVFLNEVFPFKMDLSYIGDGLATWQNRIGIRRDELDRFGMPATTIHYAPHPMDMNAARWIRDKALDIMEAAGGLTERKGASEAIKPFLKKDPTMKQLYHASGGARAGDDPKENVLNRDGKVHGLENLYVTDSSYFPSGLGVNPTLTIQANAFRIGDLLGN